MKSPFFTVIIPTFNRSDKLQLCLNSVFAQTFSNYEIVIIDNGSTDNTEKMILEKYRDFRIRYFWQEGSGSPANPRNQGILKARGDWVSFLDSDDVWYPEKLISSIEILERGKDLVCHAETWLKDGMVHREVSYGPVDRADYHSMLFRRNIRDALR